MLVSVLRVSLTGYRGAVLPVQDLLIFLVVKKGCDTDFVGHLSIQEIFGLVSRL